VFLGASENFTVFIIISSLFAGGGKVFGDFAA
jgi:hypothetical protein